MVNCVNAINTSFSKTQTMNKKTGEENDDVSSKNIAKTWISGQNCCTQIISKKLAEKYGLEPSRHFTGSHIGYFNKLGYVLLHANDDGRDFHDKQWEYPLIICHNGRTWRIYLHVDKTAQTGHVKVSPSPQEIGYNDTWMELALPIISEVRSDLNCDYIQQFCRKYTILTTDISFGFNIQDRKVESEDDYSFTIPALHPIGVQTNTNSIHSYTPEEFVTRIINVHDKDSTTIYDVLLTFREGSHIKKTEENQISVTELLSRADKENQIEKLYYLLKSILAPPNALALPHTTNTKQRTTALVGRIAEIYDIDKEKEPSYKIIRGQYDDGIIKYPYVFEILAIPLTRPLGNETETICAVNYSVSPRGNNFEGDYEWHDKNGRLSSATNIRDLLEKHGFHTYYGPTAKLPCVVVANLVTPRRDPHGYDKSSIDTQPFRDTIVTAIGRLASGIQTFRAAGYTFQKADDYRSGRRHDVNIKVNAKSLLEQFLTTERGLKLE